MITLVQKIPEKCYREIPHRITLGVCFRENEMLPREKMMNKGIGLE